MRKLAKRCQNLRTCNDSRQEYTSDQVVQQVPQTRKVAGNIPVMGLYVKCNAADRAYNACA
eukprot:765100-Hanusia_phi.AAC.3